MPWTRRAQELPRTLHLRAPRQRMQRRSKRARRHQRREPWLFIRWFRQPVLHAGLRDRSAKSSVIGGVGGGARLSCILGSLSRRSRKVGLEADCAPASAPFLAMLGRRQRRRIASVASHPRPRCGPLREVGSHSRLVSGGAGCALRARALDSPCATSYNPLASKRSFV